MNKPIMTSLDQIAKNDPCITGWAAILRLRGHKPCIIENFSGDETLFNVSEIGKLGQLSWLLWTSYLYVGDESVLKLYRLSYHESAVDTIPKCNDIHLPLLKIILMCVKGYIMGFTPLEYLKDCTHIADFLSSRTNPEDDDAGAYYATSQACYAALTDDATLGRCPYMCKYTEEAQKEIIRRLSQELDCKEVFNREDTNK